MQDNGDGISPQNYETIALKHHTSKLASYADLTTLNTFGFRGEALSSLCALSRLSITTCLAADAPKGTKLEFDISGALSNTSVVAAQKGTTISVEGLFNNLPVRRRELERNVKREWSRVVGALGQYACIQTGVKISVTHTVGKGRKTTVFSTKGNPTTRENIVNVFGAKTLTALLALDLRLEMEPSSGPSQRWSTQEDGGMKQVRIVGHISRPAYGEGRQTPDRQMFFVNTRPCGLPQVAKAFNEVYKSYNTSQSPFIFANIEMDTHLYDVNVSPDKRTILLHDQAQMLECLKTSLTALFESQDHTVPISQLPIQSQPSYKQLTISPHNTLTTETSQASTLTTDTEEDDEDEGDEVYTPATATNKRARHYSDQEIPRKTPKSVKRGNSIVSRKSLVQDGSGVSLISDFLGRASDDRAMKTVILKDPSARVGGLSKDKMRLIERLRREDDSVSESSDADTEPQSSLWGMPIPDTAIPQAVQDFNRRLAQPAEEGKGAELGRPTSPEIAQERIPGFVHSQTQSTPGQLESATCTVRAEPRQPTTATITIGDHTVTSSIGTPNPTPRASPPMAVNGHSSRASVFNRTPASLFGSRLSQKFAAPGTQTSHTGEESSMNDSDESLIGAHQASIHMDDSSELDAVATEEESPEIEQTLEGVERAPVDSSIFVAVNDDSDAEYVDEEDQKAREDAKVQEMIQQAEEDAARPSEDNIKRARFLLKGGAKSKDSTVHLAQLIDADTASIKSQLQAHNKASTLYEHPRHVARSGNGDGVDAQGAEERLSLTISKDDFAKMKIIGQFNLGFILATRSAQSAQDGTKSAIEADDLFIIDQHASDEKYNFERLQASTIVQSQRLVRPKTLDLTAVEEEVVMENLSALEKNGFIIVVDDSGTLPVGQRCQLVSLPLSRETVFTLADLEELLSLLSDNPAGHVPRPSRVRKMFAMRACRSSIMIGRTLTHKQMSRVVQHMGEIDKPWNCPHGRPTMRHLCGLGPWYTTTWKEGDEVGGRHGPTDWAAYMKKQRA